MPRLSCLLLLLIVACSAPAQSPQFPHYKLFRVEDGLPQSFVSGIVQDQDGFLWIGTRDGLARYDGREFRVFAHDKDDSTSLSSNVIVGLYLDPHNLLWVLYVNQKLDCFDPRRLRLSPQPAVPQLQEALAKFRVARFTRDHQGRFWLNTNHDGLICFDPESRSVAAVNTAKEHGSAARPLGCAEYRPGQMCIFTTEGLLFSSAGGSRAGPFYPYDASLRASLADAIPGQVAVSPAGMVVLTQNHRLVAFNPVSKTFTSVDIPGRAEKTDQVANVVNGPGEDLFVESAGGIYRLHPDLKITWLWQSPSSNAFGSRAAAFCVDRSGVAWFGTPGAGLYRIDLRTLAFTSRSYSNNFVTDNLSALPGLSFDGLPASFKTGHWAYNFRYAYNADRELFMAYSETQNAPAAARVFVYHGQALHELPGSQGATAAVKGLSFSSSGELYAMDRLGNTRKWTDRAGAPEYFPSPLHLTVQTGDVADMEVFGTIMVVAVEKDGLYKIGDGRLLAHFVSKAKERGGLPTNQLTDLCKDPLDGQSLWIGTLGQGLLKWNIETGLQESYTTADGLPNNTVYGIVPDKKGNLWISTNAGICRFHPPTKSFTRFDADNGLVSNEFNRFHHFVFPDGRLSFGGLEGYSVFDPAAFAADSFPTPVAFTRLLVNNNEVQLPGQGLNQLKRLKLPYNKNFVTLEFAGLQFNQPGKIRYRYMLRGFDRDWIEAGSRNVATYTRLPAGHYTLLVNASNTSGNWSPVTRELPLIITPPLWATWWAYTLYALLALALVRFYWTYRVSRIRMQNAIELEHSKALHLQEVDEMKNRFFDNITHEFRTPLTLILTPVEKLSQDRSLTAAHRSVLQHTRRNAEELLKLINQLLDISKLEAGQMRVNLSTGRLDEFIKDGVSRFSLQARERGVELSFASEGVDGYYSFDSEKWETVLVNLLGNALKFTPAGGRVSVTLAAIPRMGGADTPVQLCITDTGGGIPGDQLPRIFDRFYMADDSGTRRHSGTGIGLALVKELAQLMQGGVEVDSRAGEGSRFTVTVPVTRVASMAHEMPGAAREVFAGLEPVDAEPATEAGEGPLLLVVEDDDALRNFIAGSLGEHWRVLPAANGREGWELMVNEMPDLVISDVMMPGLSGVELCRMARADRRTQHIGFILLTAKAAHDSKLAGLGAGADAYLTKPFHLDELTLRIGNIIQQQERLRSHLQKELLPAQPAAVLPHVNDLFLRELYRYLDERLDEPALDVESLAVAMSLSRRTLNRKLKALLNTSPNELIRQYRLQKAAALIAAGHSISEAAYTVGFQTPSYFTRCFREEYGLTPSEFAGKNAV